MTATIDALLLAWSDAEATGDTGKLDALLRDDFTGVGPMGFVLSKQEWLQRHAPGALRYDTFGLQDVQVRAEATGALVLARQQQVGTYQGQPVPQELRTTVVARHDDGGWRLAHVHTSFLAGTPGPPPLPSRPQVGPSNG